MNKFNDVYKSAVSVIKESKHSDVWWNALGDVVKVAYEKDPKTAARLAEALDDYAGKFPMSYQRNDWLQNLCDIVWEAAGGYIPSPETQSKAMGIPIED